MQEVLLWLPPIASAGFMAYWGVYLYRVLRIQRTVPGVRSGLATELDGPPPRVSIIVPAHDEEDAIAPAARSLLAQDYPDLELIFVLDRCTDRTRARLDEAIDAARPLPAAISITIIENASCPPDWAGKCHAANLGAAAANGQWLLFIDADTSPEPRLIRAAVALASTRELDLMSLLSTLETRYWFERVVQPVASMTLMRMYPLDLVNRPGSRRNFANGQFMLFSRRIYEGIGGHAAVKDDLLEDISFARIVRRSGGRGGVFFDDAMLRCAMYETFEQFRRGWKRIFIEACKRRPARLRSHGWRLIASAFGEPLVHLVALGAALLMGLGDHPLAGAAAALIVVAATALKLVSLRMIRRRSAAPRVIFGYERGAWHLSRMLFEAARDLEAGRPLVWGGREYVLEPGSAH